MKVESKDGKVYVNNTLVYPIPKEGATYFRGYQDGRKKGAAEIGAIFCGLVAIVFLVVMLF